VLPRHPGDGVGLEWPAKRPPFERLLEISSRVHAALSAPAAE